MLGTKVKIHGGAHHGELGEVVQVIKPGIVLAKVDGVKLTLSEMDGKWYVIEY